MAKHGAPGMYLTDGERRAMIALAWHDVVCPEGSECRDRPMHAASQQLASTGHLERFLERLSELELEEATSAV